MVNPITLVIKKTVFKNRINKIKRSLSLYDEQKSNNEIVKTQIARFNYFWHKAYSNNTFYKIWKNDHKLPDKISSINDIISFPILNKNIINENYDLILPKNKNFRTTYTGGTSGITTKFPTDKVEAFNAYVTSYTGRCWWNIEPLSKILMLWGHSHLFESGLKGKFQHHLRKFKDFIINTKRISSYELSEKNLMLFYDLINDILPTTVISYSGNIFKLAKFMDENNLYFKFGKIKNVIVTSETIYKEDIKLIKKRFAHNVINEYGMAETGVIGYSKYKTQNIKVFWNSFILTHDANNNLFLSTMSQRVFPLINYDTEDRVKPKLIYNKSILIIREILGKSRNNLPIKMIDGSVILISTIYFDHLLKYIPNIYSVQYKIDFDIIFIILNTNKTINPMDIYNKCITKITEDFGAPDKKKIKITLENSSKTKAGKHSIFVK